VGKCIRQDQEKGRGQDTAAIAIPRISTPLSTCLSIFSIFQFLLTNVHNVWREISCRYRKLAFIYLLFLQKINNKNIKNYRAHEGSTGLGMEVYVPLGVVARPRERKE